MPPVETDSFPRTTARDLFMVLMVFGPTPESTLENVRLRICVDRKKQRRGSALWSAARDTCGELVKLGYLDGTCYAKNALQYESMKNNALRITATGAALLETFKLNRGEAYDCLLKQMVGRHPYLRQFILTITRNKQIFAPVISSMSKHVSEKYSSNIALANDVADGEFDFDMLVKNLTRRLGRGLTDDEVAKAKSQVDCLVSEARASALRDETTQFAKAFLNKLNDLVLPIVLASDGLVFDFRTHRTLWSIGQEFRIWSICRSHPRHDGWLVYLTSDLGLNQSQTELERLRFVYGIDEMRTNFLARLFDAYQALKELNQSTFVSAWELRSFFCVGNSCQPTVFNKLFDECHSGSSEFALQLEIQRQKPQHEDPLRVGNRNIGSVRVVKRAS